MQTHWLSSCGLSAPPIPSWRALKRSYPLLSTSPCLPSATASIQYFTAHFHPISQDSVSIFHGLSTAPSTRKTCWPPLLSEPLGVMEARANQSRHLARSQVRGRLCGGAKTIHNGDAGVRVDGTASGPSGAVLANMEEPRRRGVPKLMNSTGKRSFKRAVARAKKNGYTFTKAEFHIQNCGILSHHVYIQLCSGQGFRL